MSNSLDTIGERLKILCEEQIPAMRAEITHRLDTLNGKVARHDEKIDRLEIEHGEHKAQLTTVKVIFGGIVAIITLVLSFLKLK